MESCITRAEHEEFRKRIEGEDHRQNKRIDLLEESVRQTSAIAVSVERLATNMEGMLKEQERQGERLNALEKEPGDMWQRIKVKTIDTAVGLVAGAIITGIVMMIAQYIR